MNRRAFLATFPLWLAACSPAHRLTVGSKNFTEQLILGELLAQLIAMGSENRAAHQRHGEPEAAHGALLPGRHRQRKLLA